MAKHYTSNAERLQKRLAENPEVRWAFKEEQLRIRLVIAFDALRAEKGLTQVELSKLSDTTQPMLSRLFSGLDTRSPTLETLVKIADALGKEISIELVDRMPATAFDWEAAAAAEPRKPVDYWESEIQTAVVKENITTVASVGRSWAPAQERSTSATVDLRSN